MRALELDYRGTGGRARLAVIALAAFAAAFACDSAFRYGALLDDVQAKQFELARKPAAPASLSAPEPALSAEELAAARETARKLSMPWNVLFHALEAAKTDRVAVLAIEPDAESRTVLLSAEAKDYSAALAYLGNLAQQEALARVHLSRHELKQSAGQRIVAFTVTASWKGAR